VDGARDDLARRPHSVGEGLLIYLGHQTRIPLAGGCQVEQVTGNALADRAKGCAGKSVQDAVQQTGHLLRQGPCDVHVLGGDTGEVGRLNIMSALSVTACAPTRTGPPMAVGTPRVAPGRAYRTVS
jgi:hypothetical protein